MQKVLITGSKGQLGTDCIKVFRDVPACSGIDLPEVDLSDREQCMHHLDLEAPDVIINCAAYTAVDACESDKACWRVNADMPGYLAEWSENHGAYMIQVSTDYVFSGEKPLFEPMVENDPPAPVSEYGRAKLAGEESVAKGTKRHAVVRTAWLYGATGRNFLKTMLRLTLQQPGREIKVVNDQFGSPTWSFTLARQIRAVADLGAEGIFHASSEGYCSWYDLACAFLDGLGIAHCFVPCSTAEFPSPTRRPTNSILENARAKRLGINVFGTWRDELRAFTEKHGQALIQEIKSQ